MVGLCERVVVGLGEMKVSRNTNEILVAYGLGSCVGVAMYDPAVRIAGLLHAVLPDRVNGVDAHSPKYVDSGIAALLAQMRETGASQQRLTVRMAGGASLLIAPGCRPVLSIGARNIAAALRVLASFGLVPKAQEVGGAVGRTLALYVADGRLTVRPVGGLEREL